MHLCNSDDLSEIELPEDLDEVHNIMITEIKERVESTYKIKPNQYQIIRQLRWFFGKDSWCLGYKMRSVIITVEPRYTAVFIL